MRTSSRNMKSDLEIELFIKTYSFSLTSYEILIEMINKKIVSIDLKSALQTKEKSLQNQ